MAEQVSILDQRLTQLYSALHQMQGIPEVAQERRAGTAMLALEAYLDYDEAIRDEMVQGVEGPPNPSVLLHYAIQDALQDRTGQSDAAVDARLRPSLSRMRELLPQAQQAAPAYYQYASQALDAFRAGRGESAQSYFARVKHMLPSAGPDGKRIAPEVDPIRIQRRVGRLRELGLLGSTESPERPIPRRNAATAPDISATRAMAVGDLDKSRLDSRPVGTPDKERVASLGTLGTVWQGVMQGAVRPYTEALIKDPGDMLSGVAAVTPGDPAALYSLMPDNPAGNVPEPEGMWDKMRAHVYATGQLGPKAVSGQLFGTDQQRLRPAFEGDPSKGLLDRSQIPGYIEGAAGVAGQLTYPLMMGAIIPGSTPAGFIAQAIGSETERARQAGASPEEAVEYGIGSGLVQGIGDTAAVKAASVLGNAAGGPIVSVLGRKAKWADSVTGKMVSRTVGETFPISPAARALGAGAVQNPVVRGLLATGVAGAGGATEEVLQDAASALYGKMILDESSPAYEELASLPSWEESARTAIISFGGMAPLGAAGSNQYSRDSGVRNTRNTLLLAQALGRTKRLEGLLDAFPDSGTPPVKTGDAKKDALVARDYMLYRISDAAQKGVAEQYAQVIQAMPTDRIWIAPEKAPEAVFRGLGAAEMRVVRRPDGSVFAELTLDQTEAERALRDLGMPAPGAADVALFKSGLETAINQTLNEAPAAPAAPAAGTAPVATAPVAEAAPVAPAPVAEAATVAPAPVAGAVLSGPDVDFSGVLEGDSLDYAEDAVRRARWRKQPLTAEEADWFANILKAPDAPLPSVAAAAEALARTGTVTHNNAIETALLRFATKADIGSDAGRRLHDAAKLARSKASAVQQEDITPVATEGARAGSETLALGNVPAIADVVQRAFKAFNPKWAGAPRDAIQALRDAGFAQAVVEESKGVPGTYQVRVKRGDDPRFMERLGRAFLAAYAAANDAPSAHSYLSRWEAAVRRSTELPYDPAQLAALVEAMKAELIQAPVTGLWRQDYRAFDPNFVSEVISQSKFISESLPDGTITHGFMVPDQVSWKGEQVQIRPALRDLLTRLAQKYVEDAGALWAPAMAAKKKRLEEAAARKADEEKKKADAAVAKKAADDAKKAEEDAKKRRVAHVKLSAEADFDAELARIKEELSTQLQQIDDKASEDIRALEDAGAEAQAVTAVAEQATQAKMLARRRASDAIAKAKLQKKRKITVAETGPVPEAVLPDLGLPLITVPGEMSDRIIAVETEPEAAPAPVISNPIADPLEAALAPLRAAFAPVTEPILPPADVAPVRVQPERTKAKPAKAAPSVSAVKAEVPGYIAPYAPVASAPVVVGETPGYVAPPPPKPVKPVRAKRSAVPKAAPEVKTPAAAEGPRPLLETVPTVETQGPLHRRVAAALGEAAVPPVPPRLATQTWDSAHSDTYRADTAQVILVEARSDPAFATALREVLEAWPLAKTGPNAGKKSGLVAMPNIGQEAGISPDKVQLVESRLYRLGALLGRSAAQIKRYSRVSEGKSVPDTFPLFVPEDVLAALNAPTPGPKKKVSKRGKAAEASVPAPVAEPAAPAAPEPAPETEAVVVEPPIANVGEVAVDAAPELASELASEPAPESAPEPAEPRPGMPSERMAERLRSAIETGGVVSHYALDDHAVLDSGVLAQIKLPAGTALFVGRNARDLIEAMPGLTIRAGARGDVAASELGAVAEEFGRRVEDARGVYLPLAGAQEGRAVVALFTDRIEQEGAGDAVERILLEELVAHDLFFRSKVAEQESWRLRATEYVQETPQVRQYLRSHYPHLKLPVGEGLLSVEAALEATAYALDHVASNPAIQMTLRTALRAGAAKPVVTSAKPAQPTNAETARASLRARLLRRDNASPVAGANPSPVAKAKPSPALRAIAPGGALHYVYRVLDSFGAIVRSAQARLGFGPEKAAPGKAVDRLLEQVASAVDRARDHAQTRSGGITLFSFSEPTSPEAVFDMEGEMTPEEFERGIEGLAGRAAGRAETRREEFSPSKEARLLGFAKVAVERAFGATLRVVHDGRAVSESVNVSAGGLSDIESGLTAVDAPTLPVLSSEEAREAGIKRYLTIRFESDRADAEITVTPGAEGEIAVLRLGPKMFDPLSPIEEAVSRLFFETSTDPAVQRFRDRFADSESPETRNLLAVVRRDVGADLTGGLVASPELQRRLRVAEGGKAAERAALAYALYATGIANVDPQEGNVGNGLAYQVRRLTLPLRDVFRGILKLADLLLPRSLSLAARTWVMSDLFAALRSGDYAAHKRIVQRLFTGRYYGNQTLLRLQHTVRSRVESETSSTFSKAMYPLWRTLDWGLQNLFNTQISGMERRLQMQRFESLSAETRRVGGRLEAVLARELDRADPGVQAVAMDYFAGNPDCDSKLLPDTLRAALDEARQFVMVEQQLLRRLLQVVPDSGNLVRMLDASRGTYVSRIYDALTRPRKYANEMRRAVARFNELLAEQPSDIRTWVVAHPVEVANQLRHVTKVGAKPEIVLAGRGVAFLRQLSRPELLMLHRYLNGVNFIRSALDRSFTMTPEFEIPAQGDAFLSAIAATNPGKETPKSATEWDALAEETKQAICYRLADTVLSNFRQSKLSFEADKTLEGGEIATLLRLLVPQNDPKLKGLDKALRHEASALFERSMFGAAPSGLFARRIEDRRLQEFLGIQNSDAAVVVLHTMAEVAGMVERFRATVGFLQIRDDAGRPMVFASEAEFKKFFPQDRPVRIPGTMEEAPVWGPLAGKYVHPIVREVITTPVLLEASHRFARLWSWAVKPFYLYNVLLSPIAWARSLLSNHLYFSEIAGISTFNPMNIPHWKRGYAAAWSLLSGNPDDLANLAAHAGIELRTFYDMIQDPELTMEIAEARAAARSGETRDKLRLRWKRIHQKALRLYTRAGLTYALTDNALKLALFDKWYRRTGDARYSAEQVSLFTMNYPQIPNLVKAGANALLISQFQSFVVESIRVTGNGLRYHPVRTGAVLAAAAASTHGALALLLAMLGDDDDKELRGAFGPDADTMEYVKAYEALMPERMKVQAAVIVGGKGARRTDILQMAYVSPAHDFISRIAHPLQKNREFFGQNALTRIAATAVTGHDPANMVYEPTRMRAVGALGQSLIDPRKTAWFYHISELHHSLRGEPGRRGAVKTLRAAILSALGMAYNEPQLDVMYRTKMYEIRGNTYGPWISHTLRVLGDSRVSVADKRRALDQLMAERERGIGEMRQAVDAYLKMRKLMLEEETNLRGRKPGWPPRHSTDWVTLVGRLNQEVMGEDRKIRRIAAMFDAAIARGDTYIAPAQFKRVMAEEGVFPD